MWCASQNQKFQKKRKGDEPSEYDPFGDEEDGVDLEENVKHKGTKAAACAILLQEKLPSARVVYVSATGASEPEHLLYASRSALVRVTPRG